MMKQIKHMSHDLVQHLKQQHDDTTDINKDNQYILTSPPLFKMVTKSCAAKVITRKLARKSNPNANISHFRELRHQ